MTVEVVSDALTGPTQVIRGADGRLWVAELNGGESDGTGRVVALDDDGTVADVLLDGLDKPTGITLAGGALWVMQRDSPGARPARRRRATGGSSPSCRTCRPTAGPRPRSPPTPTAAWCTASPAPNGTSTTRGTWRSLDPGDPEPQVVATGLQERLRAGRRRRRVRGHRDRRRHLRRRPAPRRARPGRAGRRRRLADLHGGPRPVRGPRGDRRRLRGHGVPAGDVPAGGHPDGAGRLGRGLDRHAVDPWRARPRPPGRRRRRRCGRPGSRGRRTCSRRTTCCGSPSTGPVACWPCGRA